MTSSDLATLCSDQTAQGQATFMPTSLRLWTPTLSSPQSPLQQHHHYLVLDVVLHLAEQLAAHGLRNIVEPAKATRRPLLRRSTTTATLTSTCPCSWTVFSLHPCR